MTVALVRKTKILRKTITLECHRCLSNKKDCSSPFPKVYSALDVESGWYEWWKHNGYFQPQRKAGPTFSMILPPPNITGTLHLGHALTCIIQDSLARWHRMKGDRVCWVPGIDHAGIATQAIVERTLAKRGISPRAIGREKFLEEVFKWKEVKEETIIDQLANLGVSLDWERKCFTLSKEHSKAVNVAFERLFRKGLIYQHNRLVNWSCYLQTAISDIEVSHQELESKTKLQIPGQKKTVEFGVIYDVAYKIKDSSESIVVATTRPETMVGDVAVAVHPGDRRYSNLVGKQLEHPLRNDHLIPVIADESVIKDFGSGAVKISPGHDFKDFEVAERHNLPIWSAFDENGRINCPDSSLHGLDRFEARWNALKYLKSKGLFKGSREHKMSVPVCSRSGDVIEPILKPQWYLNCNEMAKKAIDAADKDKLRFDPSQFSNVWAHWHSNLRDWCISRQLWWGHRIPIYYASVKGEGNRVAICAISQEDALFQALKLLNVDACNIHLEQDEDVLDTWFSSALIPFANLGWPDDTRDLKDFFPLSLMETGNDILFFWVARMVWLSQALLERLPFNRVLLHGIICDAHGRKMSKSLGNVIDPMYMIDGISLQDMQETIIKNHAAGLITDNELKKALDGVKKDYPEGIQAFGRDSLRFGLCFYDVKSEQMNLDLNVIQTARAFCNKIWQACRYLEMAIEQGANVLGNKVVNVQPSTISRAENAWIMSRCAVAVRDVNENMESNNFHLVTRALRRFMYSNLCDVYLETTKPILQDASHDDFAETLKILSTTLITGLKLMHPIMPFVTEELYQRISLLPGETREESIMISLFPLEHEWEKFIKEPLMSDMEIVLEVVTAIRRVKKHFNIPRSARTKALILSQNGKNLEVLASMNDIVQVLACCGELTLQIDDGSDPDPSLATAVVSSDFRVFLNVKDSLDVKKETKRTLDEIERIKIKIKKIESKLEGKSGKGRKFAIEKHKLEMLKEAEKKSLAHLQFLHKMSE